MRRKPNNRQKGYASNGSLYIATMLVIVLAVFAAIATLSTTRDVRNIARHNDMIEARGGYLVSLKATEIEAHYYARTHALSLQQLINTSARPVDGAKAARTSKDKGGSGGGGTGTPAPNLYQQRLAANQPPFTLEEARNFFGRDTALTRVGFDMGPNPWPPGSDEYRAGDYLRAEMQRLSVSAHLHTQIEFVLPISDPTINLPHDPKLSDYVYGVLAVVKNVSEAKIYGDDVPVAQLPQPKGEWSPTFGSKGTPVKKASVIGVPDDSRCFNANSAYTPGQCGPDSHLRFNEYIGDGVPFCECEANNLTPPTTTPPSGRTVQVVKRKDVMNKDQFKFIAGLDSPNPDTPSSPGLVAPVHDYTVGRFGNQRARYSGQFEFRYWVRFAAVSEPQPPISNPPDDVVGLMTEVIPEGGGCPSFWNTTWVTDANGNEMTQTTVTTICPGQTWSTTATGQYPNFDYSTAIADNMQHIDSWYAAGGIGPQPQSNIRRPTGYASGQPVGFVPSTIPQPNTWASAFFPNNRTAPRAAAASEPANLQSYSDLQILFQPYHEPEPSYLRIER